MLVIKSFFLSFDALWRFLIFLPVIVVFTISLMIGTLVLLPFTLLTPILTYAIVAASTLIYITGVTFSGIVTIRCALAGEGVYGIPVLTRLISTSFKYAILMTIFYGLIYFAAGLILAVMDIYGFKDLNALFFGGNPEIIEYRLKNDQTFLTIGVIVLTVTNSFFSALLVPMSAKAYSASEKTEPHDMFWGFGASFFQIFIVVTAVAAIGFMTDIYIYTFEFVGYIITYIQSFLSKEIDAPVVDRDHLLVIVGCFFASMWLYCWQYAAGALGFLKHRKKIEKQKAEIKAKPVEHTVDLAELRKSRL